MSFLYDPPALVVTGRTIGRLAPNRRVERTAELLTLAVFLGTSLSLYRNDEWTRPLVRLFGARSGRDWMLNSGITDFDHEEPSDTAHLVAALVFATYPLWLRWGIRRGRRASRNRPHGRRSRGGEPDGSRPYGNRSHGS